MYIYLSNFKSFHYFQNDIQQLLYIQSSRAMVKPDGTQWRTLGEVKGEYASGVGS